MSDIKPFVMPAYVIERVMAKRGRLRVFDSFDPKETALVVVDMQIFYVGDIAPALKILPNINRLAAELLRLGGEAAWISMTACKGGERLWPLLHDFFVQAENGASRQQSCRERECK